MHASIRLFALALLAVLAMCEVSLAQTVAETASKWGLVGTWRLDCSKPVSSNDGALQYVVRGGKLFHDREFGDRRDSNQVISATAKKDGSIEVIITFAAFPQTRQFSLIKGSDGRMRAVSNKDVNTNEYTIKDGKFTANGNTTPWQTRCR
jgi:hypothetical protein